MCHLYQSQCKQYVATGPQDENVLLQGIVASLAMVVYKNCVNKHQEKITKGPLFGDFGTLPKTPQVPKSFYSGFHLCKEDIFSLGLFFLCEEETQIQNKYFRLPGGECSGFLVHKCIRNVTL